MTLSPPVQRVVTLLSAAGYRPRDAKTSVGSVPFEFSAMFVGSERALDLIVIVDTLIEAEQRMRQKVEGLARALDLVASRRPLTIILVGPPPRASTIEAMSRVCRVLSVGTPTGPKADQFLSDALAVLLPLPLPTSSETIVDPIGDVRLRLAHGADEPLDPPAEALLDASIHGADVVRDMLRSELLAVFPLDSAEGRRP